MNTNPIKPTNGRVLWFFPHANSTLNKGRDGQPLAATVAHVNDDDTVNLTVHAVDGSTLPVQNVPIIQDGEDQSSQHARWMPYQVGQARKEQQGDQQLERQQQRRAGVGAERQSIDRTDVGSVAGALNAGATTGGSTAGDPAPGAAAGEQNSQGG